MDDLSDLFSTNRNSDMASFNEDIREWDVSHVDKMGSMFRGAASFTWDLSDWDISSVEDFSSMFEKASLFSHDLCSWGESISLDADVKNMFEDTNCETTDDPDLSQESNNDGGDDGESRRLSHVGPFCVSRS